MALLLPGYRLPTEAEWNMQPMVLQKTSHPRTKEKSREEVSVKSGLAPWSKKQMVYVITVAKLAGAVLK